MAVAPAAGGAWIVLSLAEASAEQVIGYGFVVAGLLILAFLVAAWFPLLVLVAIRRAPYAPGDAPAHRRPLHPLGWVTGVGGWGLVGSCILAARWGRDSLPVILTILMVLLSLMALVLAARYVAASTVRR